MPTNITGPTGAAPGAVVTINGTGLTGVFGVSFNGYPGTIVGSSISSITNTSAARSLSICLLDVYQRAQSTGDTVTISGVIDLTTGKPATINRQWTVGTVTPADSSTQRLPAHGQRQPGEQRPHERRELDRWHRCGGQGHRA